MKKIKGMLLSFGLLLALLLTGGPTLADDALPPRSFGDPMITGSSVEMNFPLSLDFRLNLDTDRDYADIRLHYRVDRMEFTNIVQEIYVPVSPGMAAAEYRLDMRKVGGMPPGSSLTYWWQVADAAGNLGTKEPAGINIEDDKYDWQSLNWEQVTVYWYRGDDEFGAEIMAATKDALARLAADTGVALEKPVKLYIYGSAAALRDSMMFPQEWTGGAAYKRYGIMAIGVSPSNLEWGRRAIAHEVAHLVVHQATFNPYNGLPTWLDEGLAMGSEGELEGWFRESLEDAYAGGSLISVQSLGSPFSAYADESTLGYAQSYSIVDYLVETYGQAKMFELLSAFERGSGYDEALEGVYGFDTDGLDARWRAYLDAAIGG